MCLKEDTTLWKYANRGKGGKKDNKARVGTEADYRTNRVISVSHWEGEVWEKTWKWRCKNKGKWWWEWKIVQLLWKTVWRFLEKLNIELWPSNSTPGLESAWKCRRLKRHGFSPWVGKIPWRKRQPTSVFLPGKFHRQKSLVGYSPQGCKESDTAEHVHTQTDTIPLLGIYWKELKIRVQTNTVIRAQAALSL